MFNKRLFLTKRRRRSNRFLNLKTLVQSLNPVLGLSISRRLSSSANKLIRIRRASDNSELDIGFVGNTLDTQSLTDFGGYNLLGYTEDFTHSSWLKQNHGSSGQVPVITPNAVANPLTGEQNATRIDFDAVNNSGISSIRQTNSGFDGLQLIEVYLRTVSGTATLRMRIDSDQTLAKNYNITETWTKFTIATQPNHTNSKSWGLRLRPATGTSTTASVYIYAPQWVQGSTSLPYQPRLQGGASDCFVTTWYDQIGSNHATQTVATNQPKIYDVATGEVTKENGKPAMVFDGVDDNLGILNSQSLFTGLHKHNEFGELFSLFTPDTVYNLNNVKVCSNSIGSNSVGYAVGYRYSGTPFIRSIIFRGVPGTNVLATNHFTANDGSQKLYNAIVGETFSEKTNNVNGVTNLAYNNQRSSSDATYDFKIGSDGGASNNYKGTIQELIIFNKNLTSEENNILHNDINDHYDIF